MMLIYTNLYWEHLGVAASLAISIFVILGLLLRLRETPGSKMHIWAMIGFFTANTSDMVNSFAYSNVFSAPPMFFRWNDVLIPGFLVSLYFFVRALTSSDPKLDRRDWVHLLPFLAGVLFLAPSLALPGDVRIGRAVANLSTWHQELIQIGNTAFWGLWVVLLATYGGICVRLLIAHQRNIRAVFSDLEGKNLHWLNGLIATILILALTVIADEIGMLLGRNSVRDGIASLIYDVVLSGAFGLFALRAVPPLPQWSQEIITQDPPDNEDPTPEKDTNKSYARSGLRPEDAARFAARLEKRMTEGQLWRNHALNLQSLASEVAVSPIHLSEVLNTKIGMSFYDYVNQGRIRDACDLLIRTDKSVIEISEIVGFNAKSTFNASFKKITDQTPSQWRRTHKP
ncbi:helix-turn-helix transcriptional regulator [Marinovum sp. 2_MG-2023]|uniref:helix-turn-helix domain-containing protein n=1 Tax=unclassified Marinovum TaxID=2647166 RepID=UPI0026E3EF44|nr:MULTISPECIES: helix-turn-helix transcriptional regulator [unclassified Marinovum]MDO6731630.1 helix-turn-helix transcriptional regulator [Marinovum sp. 2_MG-2023]MDO6778244.1 helix-turn-helix transcriptional regulator [Marinovum sp. 1_MG-2023]